MSGCFLLSKRLKGLNQTIYRNFPASPPAKLTED
jgi:hypothetical protein